MIKNETTENQVKSRSVPLTYRFRQPLKYSSPFQGKTT